MNYSAIDREIEKIKRIESGYEQILKDYSIQQGKKITASPGFFIPPEIMAAFNITVLKIPEFILSKPDFSARLTSIFDSIVISDKKSYCNKIIESDIKPYTFRTPSGYGEDAAVSLHNEMSLMLETLFAIDLKSINIEILQRETAVYEKLRRMIRSISSLRGENYTLLTNSELSLIFETAIILPPMTAIEYISPILEEMKKINEKTNLHKIHGMLYGGKNILSEIADNIEKNGILIIEDDTCTGRRLFDISLNAESEYIFYELLDAYSYRPLTPCLRPANERYDLLYKLLKNYNIDTVIFYKDENCSEAMKDIDFLRIRMMRDGIDPLVIDENNYRDIVSEYVKKF